MACVLIIAGSAFVLVVTARLAMPRLPHLGECEACCYDRLNLDPRLPCPECGVPLNAARSATRVSRAFVLWLAWTPALCWACVAAAFASDTMITHVTLVLFAGGSHWPIALAIASSGDVMNRPAFMRWAVAWISGVLLTTGLIFALSNDALWGSTVPVKLGGPVYFGVLSVEMFFVSTVFGIVAAAQVSRAVHAASRRRPID